MRVEVGLLSSLLFTTGMPITITIIYSITGNKVTIRGLSSCISSHLRIFGFSTADPALIRGPNESAR